MGAHPAAEQRVHHQLTRSFADQLERGADEHDRLSIDYKGDGFLAVALGPYVDRHDRHAK
jgi:hypothetical protein